MWKKRRNRNSYPVENVVAGDEAPHAIAAYPDRASPKKCQLAMVDELHLQENKLGLDSIEGHRLIDGSAVTIDGYVTAEEIEQSVRNYGYKFATEYSVIPCILRHVGVYTRFQHEVSGTIFGVAVSATTTT